jgi:predicted AAA+ superfamily ATPase
MVDFVERQGILDWLNHWKDVDLIKVLTGVRRCGKSTVLRQFRDTMPDATLVSVDLEDLDNASLTEGPDSLHRYVLDRIGDSKTYVFIDEPQLVPHWERAVDSLFLNKNLDIYVTGSNAHMLSGDLATLLTGRYIDIHLLPLAFSEYAGSTWATGLGVSDSYRRFSRLGSFPLATTMGNDEVGIREYLAGVLNTILTRDVAVRRNVSNMSALLALVDFLAGNIGNLTSPKRIADTMTTLGRKISPSTVESYLEGLLQAFLFYSVPRYDVRGKRRLQRNEKYYIVDPGLRTALLGRASPDAGRVLENVVFLELMRRRAKVYTGVIGEYEIDFVVEWPDRTEYIQVAQSVREPTTLERELRPLRVIPDFHQRTLLTLDPDGPYSHDGIQQLYAPDWLMAR